MYGDVYVNLKCSPSVSIKHYEQVDFTVSSNMQHQWVLYVVSPDINVTVKGTSRIGASREIVASCLLAGLKNIADHWIYESACAQIESQLGFAVDRWISPKICMVDKSEFLHDEEVHFVKVLPVIFEQLIKEPKIVLYNMQDEMVVRMSMEVDTGQDKICTYVDFSHELWDEAQNECTAHGKMSLLQSLYDEYPELSHLWTQIRYNWFDMSGMSQAGANWIKGFDIKTKSWVKNNSNSVLAGNSSGEDRRVRQLPALDEMVKNPVSGKTSTLRSAIISLNDDAKWTREKIADWLETLDIDISFKVDNNEQD